RDAVLEAEVDGHVALERHEPPGERHVLAVLGQVLAQLRRQLVEVLHDRVGRAVLRDQLRGRLGADALRAGDVVGAVPGERLDLDRLLRRVAARRGELLGTEQLAARGVPQLDLVREDLVEVLVLAADAQLDVLVLEPLGDRRDDVVGLVSLELVDPDAHRRDDLSDALVLGVEVVGRVVAVRLVLGEVALAQRRRVADVEGDRQVVGPEVPQHVDEELGEHVHGLHGLARRGREVAERRVVGAEQLRVTVDDVEGLHPSPSRVAGPRGSAPLRRAGPPHPRQGLRATSDSTIAPPAPPPLAIIPGAAAVVPQGGPRRPRDGSLMNDFGRLGAFYLGAPVDDAFERAAEPFLYDASDLTTHAVIVGMTGSGKTGLGVALIEEAAIDGVPVLVVDPKGDMGNLALTFPELRPSDLEPWLDPREAEREGTDLSSYA